MLLLGVMKPHRMDSVDLCIQIDFCYKKDSYMYDITICNLIRTFQKIKIISVQAEFKKICSYKKNFVYMFKFMSSE